MENDVPLIVNFESMRLIGPYFFGNDISKFSKIIGEQYKTKKTDKSYYNGFSRGYWFENISIIASITLQKFSIN